MMRLRPVLFCLFLLGTGCDDGTPEETDDVSTNEQHGLVAPARDDPRPKTFPPVGKTCSAQQDAASKLRASYQTCAVDADCTVEAVSAKCLMAFMCPVPVARAADLETLRSEAARLAASYQKRCGDACAVARCISPERQRPFCNGETKRCEVALLPAEEADAGATVPDAGSAPLEPVIEI